MEKEPPRFGKLDYLELINVALTQEGSVGNVYNRFYEYSFLNTLLMRMQGIEEPVATYKRWQELGRQVIKGATAKEIIRPIVVEKKDEAGDVEERKLRFKAVRCIFALSDTTGPELPPVEIPEWHLERALHHLDIKQVAFDSLNGNLQGFSHYREFAINPLAVYPTRTMMHELGHIVLGHTVKEGHAEYQAHRGLMEFQAEATAYLVTNELDQQTPEQASHSRGYIQGWLNRQTPPDVAIRQVFMATDQILKAGHSA